MNLFTDDFRHIAKHILGSVITFLILLNMDIGVWHSIIISFSFGLYEQYIEIKYKIKPLFPDAAQDIFYNAIGLLMAFLVLSSIGVAHANPSIKMVGDIQRNPYTNTGGWVGKTSLFYIEPSYSYKDWKVSLKYTRQDTPYGDSSTNYNTTMINDYKLLVAKKVYKDLAIVGGYDATFITPSDTHTAVGFIDHHRAGVVYGLEYDNKHLYARGLISTAMVPNRVDHYRTNELEIGYHIAKNAYTGLYFFGNGSLHITSVLLGVIF
jgi:hypothetical protein